MNAIFTVIHDAENDRYVFKYSADENIEKVYLSGGAASELIGGRIISAAQQNDIGSGIHEYLVSKGKQSRKDNPLHIVSGGDVENVKNSMGVSSDLIEACKKYLNE